MTVQTHRRRPTRALLLGAAFALTLVAAACAPAVDTPTTGAVLTVSKSTDLDPAGETITVTGTGFTTTGNIGTRPPKAGQPAGVYVVFGKYAPTWKPSAGAESSARSIVEQFWAQPGTPLPAEGSVQMAADGSFSVDIFVTPQSVPAGWTLGVATYAGSGAVNSGEEILIPLTFAS
jgi:large repetitive protein